MHSNSDKILLALLLILSVFANPGLATAQIMNKAGDTATEPAKSDSVRVIELMLELEEMKLNEIMLKSKLDANNQLQAEDSIKRAAQIHQIDSLRAVTPGVPVVVESDTLFKIYAARGGHSAIDRA